MNRTSNARCVTPTTYEESDDEIPHLLKPHSSESDDEIDYFDQCCLVQGTPSPYKGDIIGASPISSISSHTRGDRSQVDPLVSTANLLPPVALISEDGIYNSKSTQSRRLVSSQKKNIKRQSRKMKSIAFSEEIPFSPNFSQGQCSPVLKLKPRIEDSITDSILPLTSQYLPTSDGLNKRSEREQAISTTDVLSGWESPSSRPAPSPRMSVSHRRSTSLNLPSSYSTSRRKNDELKLSTLREGRRAVVAVEIPSMPINYSPISIRRNSRSKSRHRRSVSFPDEVLQTKIAGKQECNKGLALESDDPALFSLLETTQARQNGRIFIAPDVDPSLTSSNVALHSMVEVSNDCDSSEQLLSNCKNDEEDARGVKNPKCNGGNCIDRNVTELEYTTGENTPAHRYFTQTDRYSPSKESKSSSDSSYSDHFDGKIGSRNVDLVQKSSSFKNLGKFQQIQCNKRIENKCHSKTSQKLDSFGSLPHPHHTMRNGQRLEHPRESQPQWRERKQRKDNQFCIIQ